MQNFANKFGSLAASPVYRITIPIQVVPSAAKFADYVVELVVYDYVLVIYELPVEFVFI